MSKQPDIQGIPIVIEGDELKATFLDAAGQLAASVEDMRAKHTDYDTKYQAALKEHDEYLAEWRAAIAPALAMAEAAYKEAFAEYERGHAVWVSWQDAYRAERDRRNARSFWYRLFTSPRVNAKTVPGDPSAPRHPVETDMPIPSGVHTWHDANQRTEYANQCAKYMNQLVGEIREAEERIAYYHYRATHIPEDATYRVTDQEFAQFGIHPAMRGSPTLALGAGNNKHNKRSQ